MMSAGRRLVRNSIGSPWRSRGRLRTFSLPWLDLAPLVAGHEWMFETKVAGAEKPGISMKVLLRNIVTGQYYQGPNLWTADVAAALDLKQTSKAVQLVFDSRLENVEVVLCYDDPRYNIVLPFNRSNPQKDK